MHRAPCPGKGGSFPLVRTCVLGAFSLLVLWRSSSSGAACRPAAFVLPAAPFLPAWAKLRRPGVLSRPRYDPPAGETPGSGRRWRRARPYRRPGRGAAQLPGRPGRAAVPQGRATGACGAVAGALDRMDAPGQRDAMGPPGVPLRATPAAMSEHESLAYAVRPMGTGQAHQGREPPGHEARAAVRAVVHVAVHAAVHVAVRTAVQLAISRYDRCTPKYEEAVR